MLKHVAFIMDGNGRWARARRLPRIEGHRNGARRAIDVATECFRRGIDVVTLYAFSTENWTRPESEINALFSLLRRSLKSKRSHLFENRIRLRTIGDIGRLPPDLSADIEALGRETETFGHSLVLAINYGARDEIVRAFTRLERQGCSYPLTWETLSQALDTRGLPDPDLVVRTSGEQRLSNYLLLQAAYAELYFTPTAWPDFDVEELDLALKAYESRQRRFGDVGQET